MSIESLPSTTSNPLNRADLASFLPSPRTIKAYELLQADSSASVGKINELVTQSNKVAVAPVIVASATDAFENARVITGPSDIEILLSPGVAELDLTDTGVTPGTYGTAARVPQFTVSAKGRLIGANSFPLVTDNVAEGITNLYFTQARARASISAGSGIDYNNSTGAISAHPAGTYGAPTGILSRAAFGGYVSPAISNPPTTSEVQAISDALQTTTRLLMAIITDMRANGNLS